MTKLQRVCQILTNNLYSGFNGLILTAENPIELPKIKSIGTLNSIFSSIFDISSTAFDSNASARHTNLKQVLVSSFVNLADFSIC